MQLCCLLFQNGATDKNSGAAWMLEPEEQSMCLFMSRCTPRIRSFNKKLHFQAGCIFSTGNTPGKVFQKAAVTNSMHLLLVFNYLWQQGLKDMKHCCACSLFTMSIVVGPLCALFFHFFDWHSHKVHNVRTKQCEHHTAPINATAAQLPDGLDFLDCLAWTFYMVVVLFMFCMWYYSLGSTW